MSKEWVAILSGAAGIVVGLLIAKEYARQKVEANVHDALAGVGLAGGNVENIVQNLVTPQIG